MNGTTVSPDQAKPIVGVDLAKNCFVRPAKSFEFLFHSWKMSLRNRLFHQAFPTQTCGAGNGSV